MTLSIAGSSAIAFGTNSPHSRSLLKDACEAHGWKNIVRLPPSKHGALERAVLDVARAFGDASLPLTVRALAQDLSFEAVRTQRGSQRNTTLHLFSARVTAETDAVTIVDWDSSFSHGELALLTQAAYDNQLNNLAASQVRTVVRSVVRKLSGVPLGAANLYYLPQSAVGVWQQWRDSAQLFKYHTVPFEVAADPATVEHIISQLNVEVSEDSTAILEAVSTGSLEPRSAKALAKKAQAIVDKIKSYEQALGQQLDWMREPLERATAALSVSTLMSVSA